MEKLKTLKDFTRHMNDAIYAKELRQEVIKWIKELESYGDLGEEYCQNEEEKAMCRFKPAVPWIKHFFGITEEDLKNGGN